MGPNGSTMSESKANEREFTTTTTTTTTPAAAPATPTPMFVTPPVRPTPPFPASVVAGEISPAQLAWLSAYGGQQGIYVVLASTRAAATADMGEFVPLVNLPSHANLGYEPPLREKGRKPKAQRGPRPAASPLADCQDLLNKLKGKRTCSTCKYMLLQCTKVPVASYMCGR